MDTYLIVSLFGKVLAKYTTCSAVDAERLYIRDLKERGDQGEPFHVMTRRDWLVWMTTAETFSSYTDD